MDSKRVIVYCRESRDENGEKIERIETQRDILLNYCLKNKLTNITDVIMDNNVSGTKFERLDEVVKKIKSNEVDILVFKDASRLGRNLLESLKFVELADEYGVEVLFESEQYNEDLFPLLAWFNEQRAREDSKKIKRVLEHKMETGELLIKPIYGYLKVNKKLVPDPVTAPIVKKIFEMYVDGNGTRRIATILNYESIPTPSQYNNTPVVSNVWVQQQVYRMLNNRVYMGDMIYRKTQKKSFKSNKVTKTNPDQRIVIENHHEGIISRELFEQAQLVKAQYEIKTTRELSPFSGLIKCGRCGRSLIKRTRREDESFYECIKYHQEGALKPEVRSNYGCVSHQLYEKDVIKIVYDYCLKLISNDEYISRVYSTFQSSDSNEIRKTVNSLKVEIRNNKKIIEKIYEDKLNGLIGEDLFKEKYKEYQDRNNTLEAKLNEIEKIKHIDKKVIEDVVSKINGDDLDNFSLKLMFEKIIFFLPYEITIKNKQENNLSDEYFNILQNGGLLFYLR
jgi:site-specific DNA recombinase